MEIKRYTELKGKNTVKVKKYGLKKGIEVTEFDTATGIELPPSFQELNIEQLRGNAVENRRAADEIDALIADLEALDNA